MATITSVPERVREIDEIRIPEPLWSVKSRVSWGALFAGSVVAVAVYFLISLLGVAVLVTFSDKVDAEQIGKAAAFWTFASLLIAMFSGGWVSSRCTAGEFRSEAVLYGVIVWAIASAILFPLTALGIGTGVGTVLADRGIAKAQNTIVPAVVNAENTASEKVNEKLEQARKQLENVSSREKSKASESSDSGSEKSSSSASNESNREERNSSASESNRDEATSASTTDNSRESSNNDQNDGSTRRDKASAKVREIGQETKEKLRTASWWAFGGTFLSLMASILGAAIGPTLSVVRHKVPAGTARPVIVTTPPV